MPNLGAIDLAAINLAPALTTLGLGARIAQRWRLWRERRRWIGEMANASAFGGLGDVLSDVGMTRGELDFMIKGPADAGRQFEALAAATQVDVHRLSPEVLRQATWACMRCACRAPCKRWLRSGVWEYSGDSRCPNAEYCTKPVSIISAGAAWSIADGCPHPAELGRAYPAAGG